ncbi:phospholipase A1, putative [Trypanosoma cruzi marinkellei]|uniref:1-alkyl-2-acetylglycerophosphocholine esterase n=1 Tax=Trypanosoma cruzi marinkellei TaxID=85056 RepID=K2N135_TRYCR|nr:phospholipase A1, putative [Trypanosoma cruzi marinkellei]
MFLCTNEFIALLYMLFVILKFILTTIQEQNSKIKKTKEQKKKVMSATAGFFSGAPNSFWDYVISPHLVLLFAFFPLSMVLRIFGLGAVVALPIIPLGIIFTVVMFILLPIPILEPVGGHYHVGIVHVHSRHSQTMPPLAVFYPTNETPQRKGVQYIPFNDARFISGISSRAGVPPYFLRDFLFVRLRATEGAKPIPLINNSGSSLPVIIFSHGLYGYHRLYSALMADLASRGAVVVSIGHCDGSASFMRDSENGGKEFFLRQVDWDSPVCEESLAQRVMETRRTLKRLSEKEFWEELGFADSDAEQYLRQSPRVHLSGHSFGGATALVAAMQEEQEYKPNESPVQSVFVFDPWHTPLKNELFLKPLEEGRNRYTTPTLMIHSDAWVQDASSWNFFNTLQNFFFRSPRFHPSVSERNG